MKKILLGTTAIVGTALLVGPAFAEAPKLGMSGNVKFEATFVDQDPDSLTTSTLSRGYDFTVDDAEIVFKASSTADNGLEYGAKIEFEFEGSATDEAMIWLEGDWGTINLGNEDGAEDAMKVGGFSLLTAAGGYDGENEFTNSSGAITGPSFVGDTSDANKVTYYTPKMSGFQVGVSFTPDAGQDFDEAMSEEDGDMENHIGVGVKYDGEFDQVGVSASVRYMSAGYEANDIGGTTAELNDVSSVGLGAKVTFGDFAVAAGYQNNGDSGITEANETLGLDAGEWYDVAASYSSGAIKVAAGYLHSEKQTAATTSSDADMFTIGANYTVAEGLDFYGEFNYVELEDGLAATLNDNEATTIIVGTKVSF